VIAVIFFGDAALCLRTYRRKPFPFSFLFLRLKVFFEFPSFFHSLPKQFLTMPSLPLRIAILECGTPTPKTVTKSSTYGNIFATLLRSAADSLPQSDLSASNLSITTFPITNPTTPYPSLHSIDAILLTASASNAYDNDPWILKLLKYIKEVLNQRRVRIIAACFGHQIVGRALGARVGKSERGWEVGVTGVELTERGREVFGVSGLVSFLFLSSFRKTGLGIGM
jgi:hypothetical protein